MITSTSWSERQGAVQESTDDRWLEAASSRLSTAYPPALIDPLAQRLRVAMSCRRSVAPPVRRGGWDYRHDAVEGVWWRTPAELDGLGPWTQLRFGADELDHALAAELVACPWPAPGRTIGERAMATATGDGGDAVESLEVDLAAGHVVGDGFRVARSVHQVSWDGPDALLVSRREEPDETEAHRWVVDRLARTPDGPVSTRVHNFPRDRIAASIGRDHTVSTPRYLMTEWLDHARRSYSIGTTVEGVADCELSWRPLPVPPHVRVVLLGDTALLVPFGPWSTGGLPVPSGSLLALEVEALLDGSAEPRIVYRPAAGERVLSLAAGRSRVTLAVRDAVSTRLLTLDPSTGRSVEVDRCDPATRLRGTPVDATDPHSGDLFWIEVAGPVTPPRLSCVDALRPGSLMLVEQAAGTFRHGEFQVRTAWTSGDTLPPVQYTVVAPMGVPTDGETPTVLTGYGAFHVQGHLDYLDLTGASWLDHPNSAGRRCAYVFAHVGRGLDGNLLPWERQRQLSAQFLEVADQLARDGLARPGRLGALGVSHGGVLVANAVLTRPDAFGAVAFRSAVLDLVDFPTLDGTAWVGQYGDPRDPQVADHIRMVSPCHQVRSVRRLPPALLWTADNDDRVSPTHSRRFAAAWSATGGTVHYMETRGGGHDPLASTPVGAPGLAVTSQFWRRHLAGPAP